MSRKEGEEGRGRKTGEKKDRGQEEGRSRDRKEGRGGGKKEGEDGRKGKDGREGGRRMEGRNGRKEGKKEGMRGWKRRERKGQEERWRMDGREERREQKGRREDGRKGGRMEEGRIEGRGGWKRTGRKGQEERGKEGLWRVGPLITVGGVVVICSSVRWWSWLFVHHCMLIAVDGVVVVVWAFVALVVWACPSVNGMVVGAAFWFAILDHVVGGCWWLLVVVGYVVVSIRRCVWVLGVGHSRRLSCALSFSSTLQCPPLFLLDSGHSGRIRWNGTGIQWIPLE